MNVTFHSSESTSFNATHHLLDDRKHHYFVLCIKNEGGDIDIFFHDINKLNEFANFVARANVDYSIEMQRLNDEEEISNEYTE